MKCVIMDGLWKGKNRITIVLGLLSDLSQGVWVLESQELGLSGKLLHWQRDALIIAMVSATEEDKALQASNVLIGSKTQKRHYSD